MSAIVGLNFLDGRPVGRTLLEKMTEALAHRGPDGSAIWHDGTVGFGHTMLHTTPESLRERLPLVNATANLAITADARIDNRRELIVALGIPGPAADEITDSELILHAYERWGERCPEQLIGDFAFAIWDSRRQRLFCARDPMGVKPFYYYHSPRRVFVCASEIKALFCLADVPRRLNEIRIADYLEGMLEDKAITFYEDILRLPPGHALTVTQEQVCIQPYWTPNPSHELRLRSFDEYAEAYRERFTEAVRCRLRTISPVGSMLSGGLDSSSVACVARQLLAERGSGRLYTFSAIFDEMPQCDERPFIEAVLAQGDMEPHFIHGDRISPLIDLDRVLWHQDEAFFTFNLFLNWGIWGAVQTEGIRVLLDGFVGDTTMPHGLTYLMELAHTFRWLTLAQEVRAFARRHNASPWQALRYYVWRHGLRPRTPEPVRRGWRWLRHRQGPPTWQASPIVRPDFARRIRLAERAQALQGDQDERIRSAREYHHQDLIAGINAFALEVLNKAAAAFNLEVRLPFTDRRLVEFCLSLPPQYKLHKGWTRAIVRAALADDLPEKVRWRLSKADIGSNFQRGLLAFERERLETTVFDDTSPIAPYVDMAALRQAYQRYTQGAGDGVVYIWLAVTLAAWLRATGLASQEKNQRRHHALDENANHQRVAALVQ